MKPHINQSSLSATARLALGEKGVKRLEQFVRLRINWDGQGSHTLSEASVTCFSQFLHDTNLRPDGMAVFMSTEGNVVINWLDDGALIELEFATEGVQYYFERTGEEGVASSHAVAVLLNTIDKGHK